MEIPWNDIIKIFVAFAAGTLLGVEREYRDKPAGLRTIILITVGSADCLLYCYPLPSP